MECDNIYRKREEKRLSPCLLYNVNIQRRRHVFDFTGEWRVRPPSAENASRIIEKAAGKVRMSRHLAGSHWTDFGETKQNEALRKLTKANERLGPSAQAAARSRWLLSFSTSFRFVTQCSLL